MSDRARAASIALVAGLGAFRAGAEVVTNEKVPVEIVQDVPCANGGAGETVTLTGTLHVVLKSQVNDNVARGSYHYQPQHVTGYGSVSGDRYEANGVSQGSFRTNAKNGEAVISSINNFRIIGQGPGNDFVVHENVRIALHADGTFDVLVAHVGADCK
jgi:hypothetical protein